MLDYLITISPKPYPHTLPPHGQYFDAEFLYRVFFFFFFRLKFSFPVNAAAEMRAIEAKFSAQHSIARSPEPSH